MLTAILVVVVFLAVVGYIAYDVRRRVRRGGMGLRVGYVPRRFRAPSIAFSREVGGRCHSTKTGTVEQREHSHPGKRGDKTQVGSG